MTTVIEELEIDWAPFEELKDERPCYDCTAPALWMQVFSCCGLEVPKCDTHKKMMEESIRRLERFLIVTWNCRECGATGRVSPGKKAWNLLTWRPL